MFVVMFCNIEMANPNIKNTSAIGYQVVSPDSLFLQPNWDYAALAYILGGYISSIGLLLLPYGWQGCSIERRKIVDEYHGLSDESPW